MRVVFLEDVDGVAQGGEVRDVKPGFARNYLIPKQLATPATKEALRRVGGLKSQAEATRLRTLRDMKALSEELTGTQVNVEMRAGASGRLFGSVTNAIIAAKLSEMIGREIDRRTIEIATSIRQVGFFDVGVRLHSDVQATVKLLVYPAGTDPEDMVEGGEEGGEDGDGGEDGPAQRIRRPKGPNPARPWQTMGGKSPRAARSAVAACGPLRAPGYATSV